MRILFIKVFKVWELSHSKRDINIVQNKNATKKGVSLYYVQTCKIESPMAIV